MGAPLHLPQSVHPSAILGLNVCLFVFGMVLLVLPTSTRRDLSAWKHRQFPIYPEGRPTSGSSYAQYFPAHLHTSDNAAQIALGVVAALYGGASAVLLYLQLSRPRFDIRPPYDKIVGWVAMMVAGGATTLTAAVAAGLSFGGNDAGNTVDLHSVGYWPWKNMFPTIDWSIEGWSCQVSSQLGLAKGTIPAQNFGQMCNYAIVSKWTTLILLILGVAAVGLAWLALVEQRRLERGELGDGRVDPLRDSEKGGKEP